MSAEIKLAQVKGIVDSTLGSVRPYNREDLRRRFEMVQAVMDGNTKSNPIFKTDLERQNRLDTCIENGQEQAEALHGALMDIMRILGLAGESGTETLMYALNDTLPTVFQVIDQEHESGLFVDSCSVLAQQLLKAVVSQEAVVQ